MRQLLKSDIQLKISVISGQHINVQYEIPAGLNKNDCKIVAYLQDKNSRVIAGAKEPNIQQGDY